MTVNSCLSSEYLQSSVVKVKNKLSNSAINSSLEDSVFYSNSYEELMETTRGICRDYICFRLKRNGFRGKVVITKYEPAQDQNLSHEILKIGQYFEDLYPRMFRNLARQLGYVIKSQHELRHLFFRLGTNILGTSPDEYTWGRTLALFGIAGALSVDCISQGHCELIEQMVTIFCEFVETHLLTWIVERGGWGGLARAFHDCSLTGGTTLDYFNLTSCNCTKILSFAGLLVLTVFGTIVAYTSLSGRDFYNFLSRNL